MLPSDLLLSRRRGDQLVPRRLELNRANLALAAELTDTFQAFTGRTRDELDEALLAGEGEGLDFKVRRGLAHLLSAEDFSTWEMAAPLDPPALRRLVFEPDGNGPPSRLRRAERLLRAAETLSRIEGKLIAPEAVALGLFADLPGAQTLARFEPPEPAALLHRYNLSQAQGILYRAYELTVTAYRNDPGQYKRLFRCVKLFGLMVLIEGDADHGFTLRLDGPASLFAPSTRYGLAMAKLLPALLHVSRWSLRATLKPPRRDAEIAGGRLAEEPGAYGGRDTGGAHPAFALEAANCGLVSHYKTGEKFDSILEEAFAARWTKLDTPWRLEREVDLVPVPGSAIVPDFRLAHPDGRSALLEIVGYWRPEYLRKKFALLRRSGRRDLILAVSERLNLASAGVEPGEEGFGPERLVWFKGRLDPAEVLALVEAVAARE